MGVAIELLPASQTNTERSGPRIRDGKSDQNCYTGPGYRDSLCRSITYNTLEQCGTHEYEIPNPKWTETGNTVPPSGATALAAAAPYTSEKAEPTLPEAVPDWQETVNLEHVEDLGMRNRIMNMLDNHAKMWDGSLGEIKATSHRLALDQGARPYREMPRSTGPSLRKRIAEEIQKMLHVGFIEPATSEWSSPVLFVSKKDRSLLFCIDYRHFNAKGSTDAYSLCRMVDSIDSLGDTELFTTLDCNSGYLQVPVAPEDQDKTTFTTHFRTFRYTCMPLGLKNAPATFQRALDVILSVAR